MTEQGHAIPQKRNISHFERFLDWWGHLRPFERSGRIYEYLAIRPVYSALARIFGEPRLPSSRAITAATAETFAALSREEVRTLRDRSHYFESVHLFIGLTYMPLALIQLPLNAGLTLYALVLILLHLWIVPVERYKRALCVRLLSHTDPTLPDAPSPQREPVINEIRKEVRDETREETRQEIREEVRENRTSDEAGLNATVAVSVERHWLFGPWKWESEQLYRSLGVESFRAAVLEVDRITSPIDQRQSRPRSIASLDPEDLGAFEQHTRIAQTSHLFGIGLHLPFLIGDTLYRSLPGMLYILFLLAIDTYALLLQRATRIRLRRVLERRRMPRNSYAKPGVEKSLESV